MKTKLVAKFLTKSNRSQIYCLGNSINQQLTSLIESIVPLLATWTTCYSMRTVYPLTRRPRSPSVSPNADQYLTLTSHLHNGLSRTGRTLKKKMKASRKATSIIHHTSRLEPLPPWMGCMVSTPCRKPTISLAKSLLWVNSSLLNLKLDYQ